MFKKIILFTSAALLLFYAFAVPSFAAPRDPIAVSRSPNGYLIYDVPIYSTSILPLYNYYGFVQSLSPSYVTSDYSFNLSVNYSASNLIYESHYGDITFTTAIMSQQQYLDILDSYFSSGYLFISLTLTSEILAGNSINSASHILDTSVLWYGSKWSVVSYFGNVRQYSVILSDPDVVRSLLSGLLSGHALLGSQMPAVRVSMSADKYGDYSFNLYFDPLHISTEPNEVVFVPDGNTVLIVEGMENLQESIEEAIQSGVDQLSDVIVRESKQISDSIYEQTDTLIHLGDDVDMSLDLSGLDDIQSKEAALTQEIYSRLDTGQVESVVSQYLMDVNSENFNRTGFEWVGNTMQRVFDLGFGEVILSCLTIGVALFVIGRKMR